MGLSYSGSIPVSKTVDRGSNPRGPAMKFLLTSGGLKNKEIINELLLLTDKASFSSMKVLFVISASNTEGGDKSWMIGNINEFINCGLGSIDILDMAAVKEENWKNRFIENDIICFGGGNEKYLADLFKESKMKDFILSLEGKVWVGISAGSMIMGKYLSNEIYPNVFPEEVSFGEVNSRPLEFLDLYFIPHLNSKYFSQIRAEILDKMKNKFDSNVYALDDNMAMSINGDKIKIVGNGEYWSNLK